MRNLKPTAKSLAEDRDRGWARLQDLTRDHEVIMLWDGEKKHTDEAVFKLKVSCNCGSPRCSGQTITLSKFELNRSLRWV